MSFTHKITQVWGNGSREIACETDYENDAQIASIDEEIAADATDHEVVFTLDVSQVKAIMFLALGAMTVETNVDDGSVDTLTLVAGVPYIWTTDSYDTFLVGTDVTKLFCTDDSSATNRLQIEGVYDPTAP